MSKNDMLGTSTLADVARLLGAFSDKLAGEDGEAWIVAFKRFLRKENPWPAPEVVASKPKPTSTAVVPTLKVWKTIRIGGMSRDDLPAALSATDCKIGKWARDMMVQKAFMTEPEPREIDLARMTIRDLGFTSNPTTTQRDARIKEIGGEILPPSAGAHLRIGYTDQPVGEYLWMYMEPIVDSDGYSRVLLVSRVDGGRWLLGVGADPGGKWDLGNFVVFGVPRK